MSRKNIESFADFAGLRTDDLTGIAYGLYKGYHVSAIPDSAKGGFLISFSALREGCPCTQEELERFGSSPNIVSSSVSGSLLCFTVKGFQLKRRKTRETAAEELSRIADLLRSSGYTDCCQGCGAADRLEVWYLGDTPSVLCENCGKSLQRLGAKASAAQSVLQDRPLRGFIGVLAASILILLLLAGRDTDAAVSACCGLLLGVLLPFARLSAGKELSRSGMLTGLLLLAASAFLGSTLCWLSRIDNTAAISPTLYELYFHSRNYFAGRSNNPASDLLIILACGIPVYFHVYLCLRKRMQRSILRGPLI